VTVRLAGYDEEADTEVWKLEDPSRLRMLEAEVLTLSRALHQRNREFADLEEQLRGERADRVEMLNVVSHELRTPITIISGYNRLLLSEEVGPLSEDQRRFLVESSRGCRRLNDFIGNLLEESPTRAGGVLEVARESLRKVIESVAELLRPLLAEHGLEIELAVAGDADWTQFDRLRIEQVLTNLIGNAITHSPAGGTIVVATRRKPASGDAERHFLEVSVSDSGPGVPAADRQRIFDAYVQAGGPRRSGSVGLGLAVCKRLVEAHGGSIGVSDRPGGGSRFSFTVPEWDPQGGA
jgi:signal transduction histidine kinase